MVTERKPTPIPPDTRLAIQMSTAAGRLEEVSRKLDGMMTVLSELVAAQAKAADRMTTPPDWVSSLRTSVDKLGASLVAVTKPKNPKTIGVRRVLVPTAGTAVQLPIVNVPYDYSMIVKALTANTGAIYVGPSKDAAEDTSRSFPLESGEAIAVKVREISELWVNASVSGEGAHWAVEYDPDFTREEVKE